jgi:hypothetical protein
MSDARAHKGLVFGGLLAVQRRSVKLSCRMFPFDHIIFYICGPYGLNAALLL